MFQSKTSAIEPTYLRLHLEIEPIESEGLAESAGEPASSEGEPVRRERAGLTAPRLRRVLGKALIDRFCVFGHPFCQDTAPRGGGEQHGKCSLLDACPYGRLFAPSTRRLPYALHSVVDPRRGKGRDLVEVTLFGAACSLHGWVLGGLRDALGLGLGPEGNRECWRVKRGLRVGADGVGQQVCGADLDGLPPRLSADRLPWSWNPTGLPNQDQARGKNVMVELLSPLRLLVDGRLLPGHEPTPFSVLVARILDRYRGVFGYGSSVLLEEPSRSEILKAAEEVPLLANRTRWIDRPDYSARQGKEMLLGGKVGQLEYGAGAAGFLPILRAGEILHVGKNSASGCGRIRIRRPGG